MAVDVLERVEGAAERLGPPAGIEHEVLELGRDEVLLDGDLAVHGGPRSGRESGDHRKGRRRRGPWSPQVLDGSKAREPRRTRCISQANPKTASPTGAIATANSRT